MTSWKTLLNRSYVPYSRSPRACAVVGQSGSIYYGVRIESASFPLTITEYQCSIFSCLSTGDKPVRLLLPADSPAVPALWTDTYKLDVRFAGELPDLPAGVVQLEGELDIASKLKSLQEYCVVGESKFPVACVIKTGQGRFISGVNVELNDWQAGLCAERIALAKALASGVSTFHEIHITAAKGDFISPCGACRQVLVEHMPYQKVVLYHPDGTMSEHTPAGLLPNFFNGKSIIS
ncbi:MAG: cytidine deaminase Cdd [Bacteroidetes bacterium HLUCCA01]|nr:MAG: cytidine deaminase Cdd [Bacteroidetes bacterium HLUCCA01]